MSSSSAPSATSAAAAASSSAAAATIHVSSNLKIVGVILAIVSGLLIGSSFVLKKKGLLRSQAGGELGEGVAYLKSALWWSGMIMMIFGELCNFAAYAFVEAIVVTPLGALSVVICAILSSFFLNEKLTFFGWLGCGLCILGSTIIALNGPKEEQVGQIRDFQKLFLAPGFLAFAGVMFAASFVIIFYFAPRYGKQNMLWYISVCSMIGGISVSVTTGLGAAIVTTVMGDNQFKYWFIYFLAAFVIVTLITEVYYLNVALALFNTAMVTPTYYVIFTFCSMVTTVVLFQGLKASATQIITLVLAFLVICVGITILQMSKVDPTQLNKLDRRSTILLQAARSQTESIDEKDLSHLEDPGMDALRGSFGTFGSMIRARSVRRMSQRSSRGDYGGRPPGAAAPYSSGLPQHRSHHDSGAFGGLKRHQLYDAPVPRSSIAGGDNDAASIHSQLANKRPTIKFDSQDVIHSYNRPGTGNSQAIHEHRAAVGSPATTVYPPLPPPKSPSHIQQSQQQQQQQQLPQPSTPTPPEGKLLEIESPSDTPDTNIAILGGNTRISPGTTSHTDTNSSINLSPRLEQTYASQPQSAPPTVYQRYRSPPSPGTTIQQQQYPDSRDIFANIDSTRTSAGATTLLSFPSVTDSGRSEEVWDDAELERQKVIARERERKRSNATGGGGGGGIVHKKYPKGAGDDDREERKSLWRDSRSEEGVGSGGDGPSDGSVDELELSLREGGIRLVSPAKKS